MPARPPQAPDNEQSEKDPLAVAIGVEITRALSLKGMSVVKLHQVTGISRTVLQGYIKGRYKPGAREIKELSKALDCSPNRLLFGRDAFREQTAMDQVLGDGDKAGNAAQFAIIFELLTLEEQRAILALLGLFAEARVGKEGLATMLRASQALVESLNEAGAEALEERMQAVFSPDDVKALEAKLQAPPPAGAPPRPAKRRKS
ncbi:MAG: XRE family transcriptional regulator [Aquabacterium sp.]|nr:MAG: XRE family transcriptional regulator [Aquabacterium sp.]